MTGVDGAGLRDRMAVALTTAMKGRDRVAVTALRSALARVSNAEAVPVDTMPAAGAVEEARLGAGAADAPRRELTEADVRLVVGAEVAEHDRAAQHLLPSGGRMTRRG